MSICKDVKDACESMGYQARSYSGRGMYGRACLGIEVPRGISTSSLAFKLAIELKAIGAEDAIDFLMNRDWNQDSMGLGSIIYIPSLSWEDEEESEEENVEEE